VSVFVKVEDGQRKIEVSASNVGAALTALRHAFEFFGVKVQEDLQKTEEKPQPKSRPRALPLIHSAKSLTVPIGEIVQNNELEPDKIVNGVPVYRARYSCPRCGSSGVRFQAMTNTYLKCRNCNAKLKLERAAEEGRDEEGNVFVATELYREEEAKQGD